MYDKVLVEYKGTMSGKIKLHYRIVNGEGVEITHQTETLLPVYENVYVKEFVLYEGEILHYYYEEDNKGERSVSEQVACHKEHIVYEEGKYGRLNLISRLSKEKQYEAMLHYKKEEIAAKNLFQVY